MIRPILALGGITFVEVTRQPAYILIVALTMIGQALSPALAMFSFHQDSSLLMDFGVSTISLSGLLLVAFGATAVLGREFDSRVIHTVLSKPVGKGALLVAKWLGLVASLLVAGFLYTLVLLLAARQGPPSHAGHPWDGPVLVGGTSGLVLGLGAALVRSLRSSRPFGPLATGRVAAGLSLGFLLAAAFDREWRLQPFAAGFDPALPRAAVLALLGCGLLAAVAVLCSVLLRRGAFVGTVVVFLAGLAFGGRGTLTGAFLPDLKVFWAGDLVYEPAARLPWSYLAAAALYALSYSLFCLGVGTWVLRRRQAL